MKKNLILLMVIFFAVPLTHAAGGFEYGMNAFQQGNYPTAFRLWMPLADAGNHLAQYNLGVMYYEGYGIPQNYAKALEWFLKAANQNYDEAQRNLGVMYYDGNGVERDDVQAYMWFDIAASNGNQQAHQNREIVAARMTPIQINDAKNLMRSWRTKQNKYPIYRKK